jgi:hypothetical protein
MSRGWLLDSPKAEVALSFRVVEDADPYVIVKHP